MGPKYKRNNDAAWIPLIVSMYDVFHLKSPVISRRAPTLMEMEKMKVDLTDGSNDGEDRNPEYCKICKLVFTSQTVALSHYAGKNHAKAK